MVVARHACSAFARPYQDRARPLVGGGQTAAEAPTSGHCSTASLHPDSGIASLSIALAHDASRFDLDGPLPEIPESNAS
jgi:hypothetical protein